MMINYNKRFENKTFLLFDVFFENKKNKGHFFECLCDDEIVLIL